jgi:hypothetical protein
MYQVSTPVTFFLDFPDMPRYHQERFDTRSEAMAYAKAIVQISLLDFVLVSDQKATYAQIVYKQ